jgi:ABC-type bacteriocin/lantibiotic exporter with double-glycine peptidase domain
LFKFPVHKPKQIEFIAQRKKTDCGIACAAMLAYCTYDKAFAISKLLRKSIKSGLFLDDLLKILDYLNFSSNQVKTLPRKGCALVTINWKKKNLSGHFVVWDGKRGQFLDPIFGVIEKEDMLESANIEEIWKITLESD